MSDTISLAISTFYRLMFQFDHAASQNR